MDYCTPVVADGAVLVGFRDADGVERRRLVNACGSVRLEDAPPVRAVPTYRGQRNWPGWWWSATSGVQVSYASWRERDLVMMLDFDPEVVGLAARPWQVFYTDGHGRERWHAPALFARRRDQIGLVIDTVGANATDPAAQPLPVVWTENVRWLAGYRQPRFAVAETISCLQTAFASAQPLMSGADRCGPSTSVLPVLFHLLWHHQLRADLCEPFSEFITYIATVDGSHRRQ